MKKQMPQSQGYRWVVDQKLSIMPGNTFTIVNTAPGEQHMSEK